MEIAAEPHIFIYDNYPGGIGFSRPLFDMHDALLARTRDLIAGCECANGCPTCVGPVGDTGPLAKQVALRILEQSYRADTASPGLMLSFYEGQEIEFLVAELEGSAIAGVVAA